MTPSHLFAAGAALTLCLGCTPPSRRCAPADAPDRYQDPPVACGARSSTTPARPRKAINSIAMDDGVRSHELMKELGVDWQRMDLRWDLIETSRGVFDWSGYDHSATLAHESGIELLFIVGYAPRWAADPSEPRDAAGLVPTSLEDYATFVRGAVARYRPGGLLAKEKGWTRGGVTHWEVWNEPNLHHFWHCPNAFDYAALLATGAKAVRQVDPAAVVVMSGLALSDEPGTIGMAAFTQTLYDAKVSSCFDVANIHPYLFSDEPPTATGPRNIEPVRRVLDANGDRLVPLWSTEFGYIVDSWTTELGQARLLNESFAERGKTFEAFFWFSLRDLPDERFGLVTADYRRRPSFDVFKAASK